jgi:outer membrane protein assembly factor BamD
VSAVAVLVLTVFLSACGLKRHPYENPITKETQQPDKVLFDKAIHDMEHSRYEIARLTLQTLINTYDTSEYLAKAKLAIADSWYREGGAHGLAQAEAEYKDFILFYPQMEESAEAQEKVCDIHYRQMDKPDRDNNHALRAQEECQQLLKQFPNSKFAKQTEQKLRNIQETLADSEYRVGAFYHQRGSFPAAANRLRDVAEQYPLYSRADEALYLLGQNYEGQINRLRSAPTCDAHGLPRGCATEAAKARYVEQLTGQAAKAYDQILTRYPVMDRADDAKRRLIALHQPVPRPTRAALAQNKAEDASRRESSTLQKFMAIVKRGPDVSQAPKVGEPSLVDPTPVSAKDVMQEEARAGLGPAGNNKLGVEIVKPEQPAANEPAPGSEATASGTSPFGQPATPASAQPPTSDANELKPNVPPDANELKPLDNSGDQALPPPVQVNEIQQGQAASPTVSADNSAPASDQEISSSKKKKKKGLKKVIPF